VSTPLARRQVIVRARRRATWLIARKRADGVAASDAERAAVDEISVALGGPAA
jgi:hypothetical protein